MTPEFFLFIVYCYLFAICSFVCGSQSLFYILMFSCINETDKYVVNNRHTADGAVEAISMISVTKRKTTGVICC